MDWDDLKLFLAVARARGLSGAATATGKSSPTLSRRILALEATTGKELFHRHARGYELTEQGQALFDKVIELEAQILPLDRSGEPDGQVLVKISAGSWTTQILCARSAQLLDGNHTTRLRFIAAEQELDIAHREAIIGIRNQRPVQNDLACRRIGTVRFAGYSLDKSIKSWISVRGKTPSSLWLAAQPVSGQVIEVTAPRNALDVALSGGGQALLPRFIGEAQEQLIQVTPFISDLTHEQWLVTHQNERFRSEVRLTIDRIYELLKSLHHD